jgi:hypothetical protein
VGVKVGVAILSGAMVAQSRGVSVGNINPSFVCVGSGAAISGWQLVKKMIREKMSKILFGFTRIFPI